MKQLEVLHFQHMHIDNAHLHEKPLFEKKKYNKEKLNIVFIRNPYDYFDIMLTDYLKNKKSILFSNEINQHRLEDDGIVFLEWLDTLNFIPFYNPQTFFMDIRKREEIALENLENFDYVVPYEKSTIFMNNYKINIQIKKQSNSDQVFSIYQHKDHPLVEKFLGKDIKLYEKTLALWNISKEKGFKSLREIITRKVIYIPLKEANGFKGGCGGMNAKMIRGFTFYGNAQEPLTIEIYRNDKLLITTLANVPRAELQKQFKLSTNTCGFQVHFEKEVFHKGDKIEVVIVPENILLPIVGDALNFLKL